MPPELAKNAKPVGVVTYNQNYNGCCKRDVLFCYDVELPEDFVPVPADGEVRGAPKLRGATAAERERGVVIGEFSGYMLQ